MPQMTSQLGRIYLESPVNIAGMGGFQNHSSLNCLELTQLVCDCHRTIKVAISQNFSLYSSPMMSAGQDSHASRQVLPLVTMYHVHCFTFGRL